MATAPLLTDDALSPEAAEVFADIRATRGTDYVNNFWRALAHDPATLKATWERLKGLMGPGALLRCHLFRRPAPAGGKVDPGIDTAVDQLAGELAQDHGDEALGVHVGLLRAGSP